MYNVIEVKPFSDDIDFWEEIEESYNFMNADFKGLHFETETEARDKKFPSKFNVDELGANSWNIVRFRETDDRENLFFYFEGGLSLIPVVREHLSKRKITKAFLRDWGLLTFCHGFVVNGAFASGANYGRELAGKKGTEVTNSQAQRKWYLHWRRHYTEKLNLSVNVANREIVEIAWNIYQGNISPPDGFSIDWFVRALGRNKARKPARKLPNSFKRKLDDLSANRLLEQSPEKSPKIPPIQANFYK